MSTHGFGRGRPPQYDAATVIDMTDDGHSAREIAAVLGCPIGTVYNIRCRFGARSRRVGAGLPLSDEERERMRGMASRGMDGMEIARATGRAHSTVLRAIRDVPRPTSIEVIERSHALGPRILELLAEGRTHRQIADELGCALSLPSYYARIEAARVYQARYRPQYKASKKTLHREQMLGYLADKSCADCGLDDPIVLEFDHLADKSFTISRQLGKVSWQRILDEIAKCEVVCCNCHRRRTLTRQGSYRLDYMANLDKQQTA